MWGLSTFRTASVLGRNPLATAGVGLLLFCATTDSFGDAKRTLSEADRLALLSNFSRAGPLFAHAADLFTRSGDHRDSLYARLGYLWAAAETGSTPKEDFEADQVFEDPLIQSDARLVLRSLVATAARERMVNETSARPVWERIREVASAAGDAQWHARAEAELGEIAYLEGNIKAAVRMLKEAILSQILHRDIGAAIYYNSMVGNGLVEAGQPENGLEYCNAVIKMAKLFTDAGFPYLAYQGKARALIALHRFAEANSIVQTAVMHARAEGNYIAEAQLLIVAGTGVQDRKTAVGYLRAAHELSERRGFDHALAWSAMELAKAYRDSGDLSAAESYATRGLAAMQSLDDKYHLPQHLALLADLNVRMGKFSAADRLYDRAADVIDALLVGAPSRQIQSSLISTLSDVYLGDFALAVKLKDVRKAYEVIERARGRSLADALRDPKVTTPMTDPVTVSAQKQINSIQLALLREMRPKQREELLEQLFETEQVFTPVEGPKKGFRAALRRGNAVSLLDLQHQIHADEVVLEYVLDEPRSFCLRITRDAAEVFGLPEGRDAIEHAVDSYVAEIAAGNAAGETGGWLYNVLLRPLRGWNEKSRLIIILDGKLNVMPFDSLLNPEGDRILESHAVSYSPSGTVLSLLRSSATVRNPSPRFLGVGDVEYRQISKRSTLRKPVYAPETPDFLALHAGGFSALSGTREEILAVSRALGWENRLLLGRDATESALKSQPLANFDIIHIAAHGIPSFDFPDRAALVLAPDRLTGDDGLLQAREIRNLPIRAELVVLSACDTGIGSVQGQEGIANLERAFLYAGAKSVLASLWAANDVFAADLMTKFYGHLAKGEDRSVALQHAKLDSLRQFGNTAIPLYWAGFVIVGDGSGPVLTLPKPTGRQPSP